MTNKNILDQYFEGIVNQINNEIDFISTIIRHNAEKGFNNEEILRDLLIKFLPERYSITSGFVIDKNGAISKQCDVIIYDSQYNPDILQFRNIKMIPVDIVYAVVEIKTTLSSALNLAIENIESVNKLEYVRQDLGFVDFNESKEKKLLSFKTTKTSSPYGIIFAYDWDNECKDSKTISNNIAKKLLSCDVKPHVIYILKKAFMNVNHQGKSQYGIFGYINRSDNLIYLGNDNQISDKIVKYEKNGVIYDQKLDLGRGFMNFLLELNKSLQHKHLMPEFDIRDYYLHDMWKNVLEINVGDTK